jgi:hypothetical protein
MRAASSCLGHCIETANPSQPFQLLPAWMPPDIGIRKSLSNARALHFFAVLN